MLDIFLYINTIKHLKLKQIWFQLWKRFGVYSSLINRYRGQYNPESIIFFPPMESLDYDSDFLNRFSVDELMENYITLLHSTVVLDLNGSWVAETRSPLWNLNLHYFEYLFAIAKEYQKEAETKYLQKIKEYILCWIKCNPIGSNKYAWDPYSVSLRLSNWIDLYMLLREEFGRDRGFICIFLGSLYEQYVYLINHIENHLLANHLFENLRTIVIASVFFNEKDVCAISTKHLLNQCKEQFFCDGVHYERSPMYQKLLLEDLLRVENALEFDGNKNDEIRMYINKVLDVSFSFEKGMERLPLFNDCGKNISKSLDALVCASNKLGISPKKKKSFSDGGYYIFEFGKEGEWRLLVDAGQPGPDFSPGHSHCEIMSFELFYKGFPVIVNCGTFAYQSEKREFFKSTKAHNTVQVDAVEQSELWRDFRMARRAKIIALNVNDYSISIIIKDYRHNRIKRSIIIEENALVVTDESDNNNIKSFLHLADKRMMGRIQINQGSKIESRVPYAEEFGLLKEIMTYTISGANRIWYTIDIQGEV